MRNIVQKSSCIAAVIALALGASGCGQAPEGLADSTSYKQGLDDAPAKKASGVKTANAQVASAEQRARDAEARARAAEAKIQCERDRQAASNRGAIVGGVTGAVIGSQVAGDGAKSEGGAIGGVAGVLAGRQIAKKDHRC